MATDSTKKIIKEICNLGKGLGMIVQEEYSSSKQDSNTYNPRHDVVWFLDISTVTNGIEISKYITDSAFVSHFQQFPFAVFEIEGSDPTTKNQVGNVANMLASSFYYKFLVTNSARTNDMYRRAVKMARTGTLYTGKRNLFVLDSAHLNKLSDFSTFDKTLKGRESHEKEKKRGAVGGEKEDKSGFFAEQIEKDFSLSQLVQKGNWSPDILEWNYFLFHSIKNQGEMDTFLAKSYVNNPSHGAETLEIRKKEDYYYTPKLDWCYGFYLSDAVFAFFNELSKVLENDVTHYPMLYGLKKERISAIFLPLLSFEIETGKSKHLNGGILNMSHFSFCGVLVALLEAKTHLNFFKYNLGISNIFFKQTVDL
jgi:hypothetical protein